MTKRDSNFLVSWWQPLIWASVCVAVHLMLAIPQWGAPAVEDEVLHHRCKIVWFEKGADWCELAHTPLYHEATSVWQTVRGKAVAERPNRIDILRSFGTVMALITALILVWALGWRRRESYWAAGLLLVHPYFLQGSLLLGYDTTIQMPLLVLGVVWIDRWLAVAAEKMPMERVDVLDIVGIAFVMALALFAKELTPWIPLALWPFGVIALKVGRRAKIRHVAGAITGFVAAAAIFLLLLWGWAAWRDFHWSDPLLMTQAKFLGKIGHGENGGGVAGVGSGGAFSQMLPWVKHGLLKAAFLNWIPVLWTGPVFLLGLAALWRAERPFSPSIYVLVCVVAIALAYAMIGQEGFYFPYYTTVTVPLLLYAAFGALVRGDADQTGRSKKRVEWQNLGWAQWACVIAVFGAGLFSATDPLWIIENRTDLTTANLAQHLGAVFLPLMLFGVGWLFGHSRTNIKYFIFIFIGANFVGTDIGHLHFPYFTRSLYGEEGFEMAIKRAVALQDNDVRMDREGGADVESGGDGSTETILSPARDLAWALQGRAQWIALEGQSPASVLPHHRIFLTRTYGADSPVQHLEWARALPAAYPCHEFVAARHHRYEIWYRPRLHAGVTRCAD